MAEQSGIHKIQTFRQRWVTYQLLIDVLTAATLSILAGSILYHVFHLSVWYGIGLFVLIGAVLIAIHQSWKLTDTDVSRYLNSVYPELEESCELVIKPAEQLNLLERFQSIKVTQALLTIPQPKEFTHRLKIAVVLIWVALLISFLMGIVSQHMLASSFDFNISKPNNPTAKNLPPEKVLPQIESVKVIIDPPAYTGKARRQQNRFNLNVEEGANVKWTIGTNTAVAKMQLILNDKEVLALHPTNSEKTEWSAQKQFNTPGFYQVKIEDKLSDYYQVELVKDAPPVVRIKTPKQYTYIDAGESTKVLLSVTVSDDYAVTDAFIYATIAKGSGEAVKFKEQKITFSESFAGHQKNYDLQKVLDLKALTLEPGDELYFYIQAQDNHQQQTRTDVYIVSIQDTAKLLSMNGMTMGVSQVPEYFRSERQIILDTEKLLKDKDSISVEKFKERCNEIGIDQKLLRLRYGKFLGEEEESSEGAGGSEGNQLNKSENFSNTAKIMDAYTDKHDNAEDATFLEKDTKEQLKNTLNEMWKAELNLRTFQAQLAVPFEYKALRLLKDLQQKSRAYVAKTAYNPPPLKLVEKRLSGDLSKIGQPVLHQDIKAGTDAYADLKKAASILDQLKQTKVVAGADVHTLQVAGLQLSSRATAQPTLYLPAVTAMHHILNAPAGQVQIHDILSVQAAIQKALPLAAKLPQPGQTTADMGLSQSYYKILSRNK